MTKPPLNGTRTHQLSALARAELMRLLRGPRPRQEFNPGIVNRLLRGELVELVEMPSIYPTRKGNIQFLRITDAGRLEVKS